MKNKKKIVIGGGVFVLFILAAIVVGLLFYINSYKHFVETTASERIGLDVKINGKIGLSFFPFGLFVKDIHVSKKKEEILSIKKLKIGIELIPLLEKKFIISYCELGKPTVVIVKDSHGKYNFENSKKKPIGNKQTNAFNLKKLKLSQGNLVYLDKNTNDKTQLTDINLSVYDLVLDNHSQGILEKASFTGSVECGEMRRGDLKIENINSPVKAEKGIISFKPLTMDIFGSKAEGDANISSARGQNTYKINLNVPNLDFENFEKSMGFKKVIGGEGILEVALTITGNGNQNLISGINGVFSLSGNDLTIYTMDLDKVLTTYESSQKFNLIDLGAFFIAGPLGTAGLKGYNYWDVYGQTQTGRGKIVKLVSFWKIKNGIANATDCALSTPHNRIALSGSLNLVRKRYDDVTLALLDENGCAKYKQSITGPFSHPKVGTVSAIQTIAGPIISLYRKAKRAVQGDKCEVFYNGFVPHP